MGDLQISRQTDAAEQLMGHGADEIALPSGDDIAADDATGDRRQQNGEKRPLQIVEFYEILKENHGDGNGFCGNGQ